VQLAQAGLPVTPPVATTLLPIEPAALAATTAW
jgi:hypothetical protein